MQDPTAGSTSVLPEPNPTLSFDSFWGWLVLHPNCILRAGTPESVLYDDDDLHWHFAGEDDHLLVQLVRGKRLVGELILDPERVTYVQGASGEREGEFVFDLISESSTERLGPYFFVMAHGFEEEQETAHDRAVH